MGANSTLDITRNDALAEMMKHLLRATDEELEEALYELAGRRNLYNFRIVESYSEQGEKEYRPSEYKYLYNGLPVRESNE